MRKAVFIAVLLLGISVGWLAAHDLDGGTQMVMMAVGGLFGSAIGGGLSRIGVARRVEDDSPVEDGELDSGAGGYGTSSREVAANFWRDEGHLPFAKSPQPELGSHMSDADKNL